MRPYRFFLAKSLSPTNWSKRGKLVLLVSVLLFGAFWFSLPNPLFYQPTSTVVEASDGQLLGAKIAADGQWRFPMGDEVPEKFEKAILTFEDKRFPSHLGVDLRAMGRAIRQNIRAGRVVSGGSTITMQVMRLSRQGKERSIFQKIIEVVLALRLELTFSKKEILALYAANAPFGGNVVGLEAAAWRYFGKRTNQLTWAEAATLAVLPNSPSIIHPGRNRDALKAKRDRLLKKLLDANWLNEQAYLLALDEPLPEKPHPLPLFAPHLVEKMAASGRQRTHSTLDAGLQTALIRLAASHNQQLKNNQIHNLAILVLDVETKQVRGYIGNAPQTGTDHGESVDIVQAPRSTGSILKPMLYALMLQEGSLLPKSLVPDIPTFLKDFRPENFSKTYDGVVPADEALSRSLNIPFVRMLQDFGVEKFHFQLKKSGITTLRNGPNHYGLSLILGGAEATLWDLTNLYASMAKRLNGFYNNSGRYDENDFDQAVFQRNVLNAKPGPEHIANQKDEETWEGNGPDNTRGTEAKSKAPTSKKLTKTTQYLTADAIWLTFQAMTNVERPDEQGDWQRFETQHRIAWKTGTSYGFKDAWAIGVTPRFAVGVWVGNADGEGRTGLTGVGAAAPVMFDVFNLLPRSRWFDQPYDAMQMLATCSQSGFLAKEGCPTDSIWAPKNALHALPCPYHKLIHLDRTGPWQVNNSCKQYLDGQINPVHWFVLPPMEEHYYKPRHPDHAPLPPFAPGCAGAGGRENPIGLEYPAPATQIYVPLELDGTTGKTVFKAVHKNPIAVLHWHIDKEYLGSTREFHTIELVPGVGKHLLTLVDDQGNRLEQKFEILGRDR